MTAAIRAVAAMAPRDSTAAAVAMAATAAKPVPDRTTAAILEWGMAAVRPAPAVVGAFLVPIRTPRKVHQARQLAKLPILITRLAARETS